MNAVQTKRISYISAARVIGILLVVLGHSYPFDVYIPRHLNQVRDFVYSFHMPLFILISGYLAARSSREVRAYIAARAKRLLIPYFVLSLAAFLPKMMVQQFLNDSVDFSFAYLLRTELVPRENVWGHFWYIPMIFFFGVFSAVFGKQLKENRKVMGLTLMTSYVLLWLPDTTGWLGLEDIRENLFYYVLGFALSGSEMGKQAIRNRIWLLGLPAALILLLCGIQTKTLAAIVMIGFVLCIGTMVDIERIPAARQIERYSFSIFLLSWPAQAVVEVVLNRVLHLGLPVTMFGMFTAGMIVPLLCVKAVEWLGKYISVRWLKVVLGM